MDGTGDTPLTPQQVADAEQNASHDSYPHEVAVAFDQLLNVASYKLLGGKALPDETISAHVRRVSDDPSYRHAFIDHALNGILNWIQDNHGAKAEAGDLQRAEQVVKTEEQALGAAATPPADTSTSAA